MVTSAEVVALHHPPLRAHTRTHTPAVPLPPSPVHCSKVKGKDTTRTGSDIRGCGEVWEGQRANPERES